jgi:MFS family permease
MSIAVKDTGKHLELQSQMQKRKAVDLISPREVFKRTTWKDATLSSCSFAGLSTNLKDGMAWGLFPLYFTAAGLNFSQIGTLVALYPASWGFFQLFTGVLSDRIGRKWLIAVGMWTQAAAIWWILFTNNYDLWIAGAIVCLDGYGTPTLQAAISDVARPDWRAYGFTDYGVTVRAFGIDGWYSRRRVKRSWAVGLVAFLP